jgi:crotonobetaine/carnitine-CoA ligase
VSDSLADPVTTPQTEPIARFAPGDRTVPVMLQTQAARFADRALFVAGDTRWTFADALRAASAWGAALRDAGIAQGDRVALICSNRIEYMQAFLGCAWIGAVAVPINTASRGEPLRHVLANSGARLLVAEADGLQAVLGVLALGSPTAWRCSRPG